MRIVFMGTPEFAVPALKALHKNGYDVVAVYSQPPRPKNRGHAVMKSPVHQTAEDLGLLVLTPTTLKTVESQSIFSQHQADLAVVVAYGLLLPKEILNAPKYGCMNIHGSLLPRWRGAAPIHRAMLTGDFMTGITLMQMDEGLDTGDMIAKAEYSLEGVSSFKQAHDELSLLGADLLIQTLPLYFANTLTPEKQMDEGVTYAHKLKKDEGHLDFSKTGEEILRAIQTLNPWPGTYTHYQDQLLKIHNASFMKKNDSANYPQEDVGTILDNGCVVCANGVISLDVIQRPGGKPLSKGEFLRGFPLESGSKFT